jgi:CheY-like chemotaxis protein
MQKSRPILLVEDDSVDSMTVERAFRDLKITNTLVCTVNGEEALEYLYGETKNNPCMILLDLNMPKMDGFEFLTIIKGDGVLKRIPVVVLTTSRETREVQESFELGAVGYMVKPVDYKKFVETIRVIDLYWTLSQLPVENVDKIHSPAV